MATHGDQVEPPVVVQIHEGVSPLDPGQRRQRDAGLVGHIVEIPIAVIAAKRIVFVGEIRNH